MRYLLYLTVGDQQEEVQYLIDRKNDFWFVPPNALHFPIPRNVQGFHTKTLIDGELVFDKMPDGQIQPKYLVFDCMVLDGNSLMNRTLDKRLAYFKQQLYDPYKELLDQYPEEIQFFLFVLELKSMQFSYAMETMFRQILPSLPHGNDGLIFTCRTTEYQHGTDQNIVKWKPEDENSIDFRLVMKFRQRQPDKQDIAEGFNQPWIDYDERPDCDLFVYCGNQEPDKWFGELYLEPQEWEDLKARGEPLQDRIVECYMDANKRWRFMRFRDDKTEANHISTANSVIESITDRVTKEDLLAAAKGIRDEWKAREKKRSMSSQAPNGAGPGALKRKADEQGAVRPSPGPPGRS
jgi:mRNA guanylyltransferase